MQRQPTTGSDTKTDLVIPIDFGETVHTDPYETPKNQASGSNSFGFLLIKPPLNNQNKKREASEPITEDELLKRIFSSENSINAKNSSYDNSSYLKKLALVVPKKRLYVCFDDKIDVDYPYLRYNIDQLKQLLDDANNASVTPTPISINEPSQSQKEILAQIPHAENSSCPPRFENSVQEIAVSLTSQANVLITGDDIVQDPKRMSLSKLFQSQLKADDQQSGAINKILPLPNSIVEKSKAEDTFKSRQCLSPTQLFPTELSGTELSGTELSGTELSGIEKKNTSPFADITKSTNIVSFRFVIGSSIENQTLFSVGHNKSRMSHVQLAAKKEEQSVSCNAAGVLCFKKVNEKWLIDTVSNKTGHFKCDVESLLTTIGMLFSHFDSYLNETITLTNESLENPVEKKSFTFNVSTLKKHYEDCIASVPAVIPGNTEKNTATDDDNSHRFFTPIKKQKNNVSLSSTQSTELVQLDQDTNNKQAGQSVFECP